ncbi:unnamed protein product [Brassica napus]|uniref:(rape) hypothetical protein n=1 Tax=Brassica napus TaxID=3708 RepID=A0A816X1T3_BRANA|nr:unnamed protein product [Brassica napus]
MERRLSKDAKGKRNANNPLQPPRAGWIKAQAPVNNDRYNKLSLTIIGRVTKRQSPLPLIKSSIIEYPNDDEVTASFIYERIGKHCSKCFRFDHKVKIAL